eukprot:340549_1
MSSLNSQDFKFIDEQTVDLVFGFIREIENTANNMQLPEPICQLCCLYYYIATTLLIMGNNEHEEYKSKWKFSVFTFKHGIKRIHQGNGFCVYADNRQYFTIFGNKKYIKFTADVDDDDDDDASDDDDRREHSYEYESDQAYDVDGYITTLYKLKNVFLNAGSKTVYFSDFTGNIYGNGFCINEYYGEDNKYKPNTVHIPELSNIKTIKSGDTYSVALSNDGKVFSFGRSYFGAHGHGAVCTQIDRLAPQKPIHHFKLIESLNNHYIDQIECGNDHTIFLENNGSVWSIGDNCYGQCGLGVCAGSVVTTPTLIQSFNDKNIKIKDIKSGHSHNLCIDTNHRVYSWGTGAACGHGDNADREQFSPLIIETLKSQNIISIKCGVFHSYAKTDSNKHYLFGSNRHNESLDGDEYYKYCSDEDHDPDVKIPHCINHIIRGKICEIFLGDENTKILCLFQHKSEKQKRNKKAID